MSGLDQEEDAWHNYTLLFNCLNSLTYGLILFISMLNFFFSILNKIQPSPSEMFRFYMETVTFIACAGTTLIFSQIVLAELQREFVMLLRNKHKKNYFHFIVQRLLAEWAGTFFLTLGLSYLLFLSPTYPTYESWGLLCFLIGVVLILCLFKLLFSDYKERIALRKDQ